MLILQHRLFYIVFYIFTGVLAVFALVVAAIVFTSLVYHDYAAIGYYPSVGLGFENAFLFLLTMINCLYLATFIKLVYNLRSFY